MMEKFMDECYNVYAQEVDKLKSEGIVMAENLAVRFISFDGRKEKLQWKKMSF